MKLCTLPATFAMSFFLTATQGQTICPAAIDSDVMLNYGSTVTGSCSPTPEVRFCRVDGNARLVDVFVFYGCPDSINVHIFTRNQTAQFRNIRVINQNTNPLISPTVVLFINGSPTDREALIPASTITGSIAPMSPDGDRLTLTLRRLVLSGNCGNISVTNILNASVGGDVLGTVLARRNSITTVGGVIENLAVGGSLIAPDDSQPYAPGVDQYILRAESRLENLLVFGRIGTATAAAPLSRTWEVFSGGGDAARVTIGGPFRGRFRSVGVKTRKFTAASVETDTSIVGGELDPEFSDDGFIVPGPVVGNLRFNGPVRLNQANPALPVISLGSFSGYTVLNGSNLSGDSSVLWAGPTRVAGVPLQPLPVYRNSIPGGSTFGLAPFRWDGFRSVPPTFPIDLPLNEALPSPSPGPMLNLAIFNNPNSTAQAREIRIRHFGPVFQRLNRPFPLINEPGPLATVQYLSSRNPDTWTDVSSQFDVFLDQNVDRFSLFVRSRGSGILLGEYRVTKLFRLRSAEVNGDPEVVWPNNVYFFRVGCSAGGGNPNPADITGIGGFPNIPDGLVTGDDFNAFITAWAEGRRTFVGLDGRTYSAADITGIGGLPSLPDGNLTGDDFNAFIANFASGCQ
jgi:hypothetical protein